MRNVLTAAALASGLLSSSALADRTGTVVELFTSQGCSSCPPADQVLADLALHDDVIALALHVDYWDYLGWRDDLGSPLFTARQKAYAHRQNAAHVYTPQIVVAGTEALVGSHGMKVMDLVQKHNAQPDPVTLDVRRDGEELTIRATATAAPGSTVVQVVQYLPRVVRDIDGGENAGLTVTYVNAVTSWRTATQWNTQEPLDIRYEADPDLPVVVIVQDGINGPVLGAVQLD
jgi:hypothetical protein